MSDQQGRQTGRSWVVAWVFRAASRGIRGRRRGLKAGYHPLTSPRYLLRLRRPYTSSSSRCWYWYRCFSALPPRSARCPWYGRHRAPTQPIDPRTIPRTRTGTGRGSSINSNQGTNMKKRIISLERSESEDDGAQRSRSIRGLGCRFSSANRS